jgi:hypothetical protein
MSSRVSVSTATWGVLSIVAGLLMTEGGVMEVIVYWSQDQISPVVVGALGAATSATLLASGVAFCTRRTFGRKMAIGGAIGMIPVHFVGWMLGIVGIPGAALGFAYPTLLLCIMRAKPNLGAPVQTGIGQIRTDPPPPLDDARGRSATVGAA